MRFRRLIVLACAAAVPTLIVAAVSMGQSTAAPSNTSLPSISGSARDGSLLTASHGGWTGGPTSYAYQWLRCDDQGGNCGAIAGATSQQYTLQTADVAHTLRVVVTASNGNGSSSATTAETDLIAPAKATQGGAAIAVAQVSLPNRLVVDRVQFNPNRVTSRSPITARFHVSDTRGFSISGALVYVLGLPYGWTFNAPETPTDGTGWATLTIQPTRNMPLRRGDLVLFVRARKPGDNLLAGVSTRRLVQEGIG